MSDLARQLLPTNSTQLERAVVLAALKNHKPEVIARLWNPITCPINLLPWLAWALSLDEWDPAWTEAQQRAMIRAAIKLHRKKGTPWAIRQALLRSGLESINIIEHPLGAHWAEFDVDVAVVDRALTQDAIERAATLIEAYKPVRSTLRTLRTSLQTQGAAFYALQLLGGDTTEVYPLAPENITPERISCGYSFVAHDAHITSVYPLQ